MSKPASDLQGQFDNTVYMLNKICAATDGYNPAGRTHMPLTPVKAEKRWLANLLLRLQLGGGVRAKTRTLSYLTLNTLNSGQTIEYIFTTFVETVGMIAFDTC
ncbi:MAG: hypothetical protein ACQES0_06710 [Bacteroidota bacterium]